eukprot:Skav213317  [mRNA]  locus=scaffold1383:229397:230170:+ [translate_table: standard]
MKANELCLSERPCHSWRWVHVLVLAAAMLLSGCGSEELEELLGEPRDRNPRRLTAEAAQDQCSYQCSKAGYDQGGRCFSNTCQCLKEMHTVSSIFESMLGHQCKADGHKTPWGDQYRCECPGPFGAPREVPLHSPGAVRPDGSHVVAPAHCHFHMAYQGGRVAEHVDWFIESLYIARGATFCLIWNSHLSNFWSGYDPDKGPQKDDIEDLSRKLYSNVSDEQFGENLTQYCARWLPIPYGCVQMVSSEPKPWVEWSR